MKWLTPPAPRVTLESHYCEQFVFKQLLTMFWLISVLTVSLDVFFLLASANSLMTFSFCTRFILASSQRGTKHRIWTWTLLTSTAAAIIGSRTNFLGARFELEIGSLKNHSGVQPPSALTFNCAFKLQWISWKHSNARSPVHHSPSMASAWNLGACLNFTVFSRSLPAAYHE